MLPYRLAEEFRDRYAESVIYYKQQPIYVSQITPRIGGNDVKLHYFNLPISRKTAADLQEVSATDPELSDSQFNLGYCNDCLSGRFGLTALYLQRMPVRRSKQGLDHHNVYFPRDGDNNMDFSACLHHTHFMDMLVNAYPVYDEARNHITSSQRYGVVAFHKHFGLQFSKLDLWYLHYKGKKIASSGDGYTFKLAQVYTHLNEVLEENLLKVA